MIGLRGPDVAHGPYVAPFLSRPMYFFTLKSLTFQKSERFEHSDADSVCIRNRQAAKLMKPSNVRTNAVNIALSALVI